MKVKFLILCLLGILSLTFNSCSNEPEFTTTQSQSESESNIEFIKLMNSIDSINTVYSSSSINNSKPYTRGFFTRLGDFACSCIVDYSVGCVASAATTAIGGAIIGAAASFAHSEYTRWARNKMRNNRNVKTRAAYSNDVPYIILQTNNEIVDDIDSSGYYHNLLLSKLEESQNNFSDSSSINFSKIFSYLNSSCGNLGIQPVTEDIKSKEEIMSSYTKEFIKLITDSTTETLSPCFEVLKKSEYSSLNINSYTIDEIDSICTKIGTQMSKFSNVDQAISYGKELNNIINNSNVSNDINIKARLATSIAINSFMYWNKKD